MKIPVRELEGEGVLGAVLGAMLGVGLASKDDLSQTVRDLPGVMTEIIVFVIICLVMVGVARTGGLRLANAKPVTGLLLVLLPLALLVLFAWDRVEFITYGDAFVLAIGVVWIVGYGALGMLTWMRHRKRV